MSFKTHVRGPQVDHDVQAAMELINCNYAKTYVIWTRVFMQDCQWTVLHRYLAAHYEWCPAYETLRTKWMPCIMETMQNVRTEQARISSALR